MGGPKISVVLPSYNGEKYIREAIESVISQTCPDWELIIINDCSTDGTLHIADEYAARDSRISVRTNPENMKLPRSLNAGFAAAKGRHLTWTSDDNRYKPEAFSAMSGYLDAHTDCGLVYCDMDTIAEDGSLLRHNPLPGPEGLLHANTVGACFMYTRESMEKTGAYDSDMFLAEDYDYWLRIYRQFPMAHLGQSLYEYRRHGESLTGTRLHDVIVQTARLKEKHLDFIMGRLNTRREAKELFYQLKDAGVILGKEQEKLFRRRCMSAPFCYRLRALCLKMAALCGLTQRPASP